MKRKDLEKIFPNIEDEQFKEFEKIVSSAYEKGKSDSEKSYTKAEEERLIKEVLKESGAKNEKAILALIDPEKITMENGEIKGLKSQIDELKKTCDYLFELDDKKPQFTVQTSGNAAMTKKDFENLSYKKRLKLFSENPELYKRLTDR